MQSGIINEGEIFFQRGTYEFNEPPIAEGLEVAAAVNVRDASSKRTIHRGVGGGGGAG